MTALAKLIATFFYVGYLRPASGTWGSAAAIPVAWLVHWGFGFPGYAIVTVMLFVIGLWATGVHCAATGGEDPSEVVIDEVLGMFVAMIPLSAGLWFAGVDPRVFPYPGWVAAFLLFRLFDIWKPGPIGWADRKGGAMGVMLDDVLAGLVTAFLVALSAFISHTYLM